jgi:pimeloyl-ACP methyl ester carboxylesterase
MADATERGATRVTGFSSAEMDFQFLRQLGSAAYGGASVGECLATAARVTDGDPDSWAQEFASLARFQEEDGERLEQAGHGKSASQRLFAASNSYRAAEYYGEPNTGAHQELGLGSRRCMERALQLAGIEFLPLAAPFEGKQLPGYYFPPGQLGSQPSGITFMAMSGFDGTCEEMWFQCGRAALERGHAVCLFAGPGQADLMRAYPEVAFRPDYEAPVAAVIDRLAELPGANLDRLALYGVSLGGYFVLRAAAFEPRVRAVAANSPILDLHAYLRGFMPHDPAQLPDEEDYRPEDIEIPEPGDAQSAGDMPEESSGGFSLREAKRSLGNMCRRYGRPTAKGVFTYLKQFNVSNDLDRIRIPALAMVSEGEGSGPLDQASAFATETAGSVHIRQFTAQEGADAHCQLGNLPLSNAVLLDWLEEKLG